MKFPNLITYRAHCDVNNQETNYGTHYRDMMQVAPKHLITNDQATRFWERSVGA